MGNDISLKSLDNIKHSYSTMYEDSNIDLINEFFIPCLSKSVEYWRLSAFYNSEVLIYLFQGLKPFIKNGGKIKLLLGCIPDKEFEIINNEKLEQLYSEAFINKLLTEDFPKEKTAARRALIQLFAWLIDTGRLEIRLGFIINKNNKIASKEEILVSLREGMLHDKIGIFFDKEGNSIGFRGSLNETTKALLHHCEGIDVHKSWEYTSGMQVNVHLESYKETFLKLWNNKIKKLRVYKLPNAQVVKLKQKYSIDEYSEAEIERDFRIIDQYYITPNLADGENKDIIYKSNPFTEIKWKKPQIEAFDRWKKNGKRGILAIATGVGKTLIGIRAIVEFLSDEIRDNTQGKIVAIAVHNNSMIEQWKKEIEYWFNKTNGLRDQVSIIDIKGGRGRDTIDEQVAALKAFILPNTSRIIIICHYNIFAQYLIHCLNSSRQKEILFIADEVHEMGSNERMNAFKMFKPTFCMGLSATPERYWDSTGATEFINNFFKGKHFSEGIIYRYEISDAIKDKYLCPYIYFPIQCTLEEDEIIEYRKYSRAIAVIQNDDEPDELKLKSLKLKRKRIIKKAKSKIKILIKLIEKLEKQHKENGLKHVLIYVEDNRQLEAIKNELIQRDFLVGEITHQTKLQERKQILNEFKKGLIQIVLAMLILDQGVNIPQLRIGIITASTGNIKQFIQRRGRLLRIDPEDNNKIAEIYDLVVPYYIYDNEKVIIESEIERVKVFSEDSLNRQQIRKILQEWNK